MKVTRTPQDYGDCMTRKAIANRGCNVCPCCGETKNKMDYIAEGIFDKGIRSGLICKHWAQGILRTKYMQIDCYSCDTCGAAWESEPYERMVCDEVLYRRRNRKTKTEQSVMV